MQKFELFRSESLCSINMTRNSIPTSKAAISYLKFPVEPVVVEPFQAHLEPKPYPYDIRVVL